MAKVINVLLVGSLKKTRSFKETLGLDVRNGFDNIVEEKFIIKDISHVKEIEGLFGDTFIDLCNHDVQIIDCHAVIYMDATNVDDKIFVKHLQLNNNPVSIELNDENVSPLDCLHQIEELINQRLEKSMLVLAGNKDSGSSFSRLPTEVATMISSLQFDASSQHSANFFSRPALFPPVTEAEEEVELYTILW